MTSRLSLVLAGWPIQARWLCLRGGGRQIFNRAISLPASVLAVVCSALFICSLRIHAQPAPQTQPVPSTYTLQANTWVVLVDVTVTDKNGNPVQGLPQSAFSILDNKQPQVIASFEEHAGLPAANLLPASTSGLYSNDYLLHLPPSLNIVVIDLADIGMDQQMYLNYQLTKFLNEQPTEMQPLAIFLRADSGCFLLQNFTSDRKLLLDAVHKAIPRFPPLNREFLTDFEMLKEIASSLSQLPGRKNVLWFSGGSSRFLTPNALYLQNDAAYRELYDQLDQERIAIYPIDARGLMVILNPNVLSLLAEQHVAMNEVAQATGGQAFYDNNGFQQVTQQLLNKTGSFYTVTYSPPNLQFNNKWHKIRVAVSGHSYQLSYRSGYFADGSLRRAEQPFKPRTRLLANGDKLSVPEANAHPIIFQARVLPTSDPSLARLNKPMGVLGLPPAKKGSVPFLIRYFLPIDAFTVKQLDGKPQVVLGVAVTALNRAGDLQDRYAREVTMTFKAEALGRNPNLPITLDQQVNLTQGDQFLNLGVWDPATGRAGSIQIPLEVPKPSKHPVPPAHN